MGFDLSLFYRFPLETAILSQSYEIEEMIESYLTGFDAIIPRILLLKHRIQTAEEQVLSDCFYEIEIINTLLILIGEVTIRYSTKSIIIC